MVISNSAKKIHTYFDIGKSSTVDEDYATLINAFDEFMMALVELTNNLNIAIDMKLVSQYITTRDLLNELEPYEISQQLKSVKIKKIPDFEISIENENDQNYEGNDKGRSLVENCTCTKGKCLIF